MFTYQIGIAVPAHWLRAEGFNGYEAEEETARISRVFSRTLKDLGYKSSTSGDRLYDGYDGKIITDRMIGLDGIYAFVKLKEEYVVPLFMRMIGPKLLKANNEGSA